MERDKEKKVVFAFVDAANLFYGGQNSLGWSIDYQKLHKYLQAKFGASKIYYYAGIEAEGFTYDPLKTEFIDIHDLLSFYLQTHPQPSETLVDPILQRIKFYRKLEEFGYTLRLKPTKVFHDGTRLTKKANCDVDMTFDMMRYMSQYNEIVALTGDGDFAIVLQYLRRKHKSVHILARSERTARDIRRIAGKRFMDFNYLREILKFNKEDIKNGRDPSRIPSTFSKGTIPKSAQKINKISKKTGISGRSKP